MDEPEICESEGCGKQSIVGWGEKPIWLCSEHFAEALEDVALRIEAATRD